MTQSGRSSLVCNVVLISIFSQELLCRHSEYIEKILPNSNCCITQSYCCVLHAAILGYREVLG
jgi:hypothetical protein